MEISQENDRPASQTSAGAAGTVAAVGRRPPQVVLQGLGRPIVLSLKRKKKRKYSSSLKERQLEIRRSSKAGERIFEALAAGFGEYRKKANKSSKKKKDGELKDFSKNTASGLAKAIKKLGKVPRIYRKSRYNWDGRQLSAYRYLGSAPVQLAMAAAAPELAADPFAYAAGYLLDG